MNRTPSRLHDPDSALRSLVARLGKVGIESAQENCLGRVLAQEVLADRDSPAADVSAMDGYAIRMSDVARGEELPVSGESSPGKPPPESRNGHVVRVFTGAIVPAGFDAVVKREDTRESDGSIAILESAQPIEPGMHIRRAGENARAGSRVLGPGRLVTAAEGATMANFGCRAVDLFAPVRVTLVTTGNEVGDFIDQAPMPWQLRNSNRAAVSALLEAVPWVQLVHVDHCRDDRNELTQLLRTRLTQSDAILLTGGVSMGNYDYVPEVIREIGGDVVFHGLPIRPGKPILGAASKEGKLLMGLPGNPVSASVGCRRMAMPLLSKIAGLEKWMPIRTKVQLANPDANQIPLHWMRLVKLVDHGVAELVDSLGSGDLVSLGQSSGFVELPPNAMGNGPWPYVAWA